MIPKWGYRVVRCREGTFEFREVFCDDRGQVVKIAPAAASPKGENRSDLLRDLDAMLGAYASDTLDEADGEA
ncbi:hypothetical protein EP7_004295 [Isosphaeraceae bacterium EP7]